MGGNITSSRPGGPADPPNNYLVNYAGKKLEDLLPPAVLAYELATPHEGKRHVLFADGHVEAMTSEAFDKAVQALPADLRAKETTTDPTP